MLCIHYFLIKRKKLFGRPNTRFLQIYFSRKQNVLRGKSILHFRFIFTRRTICYQLFGSIQCRISHVRLDKF